ncbi:MAG: glutamine--fructose-6-phosphate transaminase (isomerizing) [Clostridium sp.]
MCGIVGYIGNGQATPFLIEGLKKLEYRGYDSSGVAILNSNEILVRKAKGRLSVLEESIKEQSLLGSIGIGHTRWATHGEPSNVNSHPHTSSTGEVSVVHNGIIENYIELREFLIEKGYEFKSQTDTEVIPNLVNYFYEGNLLDAVIKASKLLRGSYAIAVIVKSEPDKIIAVRKDSPMIVGVGDDEYFIASDIPAVLNKTRNIYLLEDKEFVELKKEGITIFNSNKEKIDKNIFKVTWSEDAAEKGGYEHFMLKEIHEQPKALRDTISSRVSMENGVFFDNFNISKDELENIDRIFIVACGTAYHAGLIGKQVIERLAKIPVEVDIASEFRYRSPLISSKSLMITLSQSGETADTLAAVKLAKHSGARVIAITNVVGSTISREANDVIYTMAGPEIAVASTKAYTTQVLVMYLIGILFGKNREMIDKKEENNYIQELMLLSDKVERILSQKDKIKIISREISREKDLFYLGRGLDYALAMEASLKLKEISYIHSEAYAGGELKHGTIALIEKGTKVICILNQKELKEKMISNIVEIKSRGAYVIGVCYEEEKNVGSIFDEILTIPDTMDLFAPILSVVTLQLLAYYVSLSKGLDVDKPRNLAKSVTVE